MRFLPTSYVETARQLASLPGAKSYSEWLEQLNAKYGMDVGILKGYSIWLSHAFQGDFGDSWQFNVPVTEKFGSNLGFLYFGSYFFNIAGINFCST